MLYGEKSYQGKQLGLEGKPDQETEGVTIWRRLGKVHRLDGPAIVIEKGVKYQNKALGIKARGPVQIYMLQNTVTRPAGPAVIIDKGGQLEINNDSWTARQSRLEAYLDEGSLHRLDGPALISDRLSAYYIRGKLHREASEAGGLPGPAVEYSTGRQEWWQNGKLHREASEAEDSPGPAVIDSDGTRHWFWQGLQHRQDGPALHKLRHRKEYFIDGELHRVDGPAVIDYDQKTSAYYLHGQLYQSKSAWREALRASQNSQLQRN
jgi:hypothetical protein